MYVTILFQTMSSSKQNIFKLAYPATSSAWTYENVMLLFTYVK